MGATARKGVERKMPLEQRMTNRGSPTLREFAQDLLESEATSPHRATAGTAADRVCEKLRRPLSTLAGDNGFHSLVQRALTMAKREVPALRGVHVGRNGALIGLAALEPRALEATAELSLITHLLELVASFIGEELTMSLVRDAWRRATHDDLHSPAARAR